MNMEVLSGSPLSAQTSPSPPPPGIDIGQSGDQQQKATIHLDCHGR